MNSFDKSYYKAFDILPCGVVLFNIENYEILYANEPYTKLLGNEKVYIHKDDIYAAQSSLKKTDTPCYLSVRCKTVTGDYIYTKVSAVRRGNIVLALGSDDTKNMTKINKIISEGEKLKEKTLIDPLSKVYNREPAIERIKEKLKTLSEYEECALIVLDIDNFKYINDTFGHLYGDAIITMAAGGIVSVLDSDSIVGRFGGDEFFIFLTGIERAKLENKLESIRLAILQMRDDIDNDNSVSCSMGVTFGHTGSEYEELFLQADSALYVAKKNGKNRFEYFDGNYAEHIFLSYSGMNAEIEDDNESTESHDITTMALEIASKSANTENAISNIMRHIGIESMLDCIQVMKYDAIEDKIYVIYQWWRERDGVYNEVYTEIKSGYYDHNDLEVFRKKFRENKTFCFTHELRMELSPKFQKVLEISENISTVYSSSVSNEDIFYVISYQCWDSSRQWTQEELDNLYEITKILSMFMKSNQTASAREKTLENALNYSQYGLYSLDKFYEEAGRIGREARNANEKIAVANFDFDYFHRFNRIYGLAEGDRILYEFSKFLLSGDGSRVVSCYINGTDSFYMIFRYRDNLDVCNIIENKITDFCKRMGEYKEHPLIIKAGVCFFENGQPIFDAIDYAKSIKHRLVTDKCICISHTLESSENVFKS